MLLDPLSRYFVRHELNLRPYRNNGAALRFISDGKALDVADILERAIDGDKTTLKLKKNDVVKLTELQIREDEELAILLFRRSDPDATCPMFENRKTKKLWAPKKGPDDAEAVSAHLFLHLDAAETPHPTYRAILEEVPGLGRTYIQAVLHEILKDHKYAYEDDRGDKKETYTIPRLQGCPSQNLVKALNGGGINYIELIRPPKVEGLDIAGLVPREERMKLTVKATSKKGALASLNKVREWMGSEDWQKMKVSVTEGDRTKVVDVAREADAADVLFVHSELVEANSPIAQCADTLNEELIELAQGIFTSSKKW